MSPSSRRARWTVGVLAVLVGLTGCTSGSPVPPAYTQDELRARCVRQGGWWHPDGQFGGLCEYDSKL